MAPSWETVLIAHYRLTALKMHCSSMCVSGARSLAGNCSGDPTPCCSVAHYLFPTQRQHQEPPTNTVPAARGSNSWDVLLTRPSCRWAKRLWWRASTGSVFWLVETLLLHTWHDGRAWEPVQCRTKQTNAFSFILVSTVSLNVIWSFLWYLKVF